MWMLVTAVTVCTLLSVSLLPATEATGGGLAGRHRTTGHVGAPGHGGVPSPPVFRPKGAFGSPGGFPLAASHSGGVFHDHLVRRFPSHTVVTWFPSPAFLYGPTPSIDTSPPVINVSPVIYASPIVYVPAAPVVSAEPAPVAMTPVAPPSPTVVEYPTGRYELRGDGVATPYTWVWVPSPPPAPPPSPAASVPGPALPERRGATYRWTNDEGTTFWTNRLERVPERYRPRAQLTGEAVENP